jgi:glycosyltransferase involved in cell wall biosynthesis
MNLPCRHRIAIYCERDAGMYDAINRGLARASGELCAYLNCDEQYLAETLHKVCEWFAKHPHTDVLFADALLLNEHGQALSYRRTVLPDRWHTRLCHLNTLTCSTFFKRRVFESGHRFPTDKKVIGDGVWVDGMISKKVPMGYLRHPTSTFAFTGENLSELDSGADSEQRRWLQETGWPPSILRLPVSAIHRFRKLLAGAYFKRNLEYSIFTKESMSKRVTFSARNLGSAWPKQPP